jgi:hypothetical protein
MGGDVLIFIQDLNNFQKALNDPKVPSLPPSGTISMCDPNA